MTYCPCWGIESCRVHSATGDAIQFARPERPSLSRARLRRVVLRCTKRLLALLGSEAVTLTDLPPADDDWYGNLLWLDRRTCLLLTHAGTLFSIFRAGIRKHALHPIGPYIVTPSKQNYAQRTCHSTRSALFTLTTSVSRRRQVAARSAS